MTAESRQERNVIVVTTLAITKHPLQIKRVVLRGETARTCVQSKRGHCRRLADFGALYFIVFENKLSTLCVKGRRRSPCWPTSASIPPQYKHLSALSALTHVSFEGGATVAYFGLPQLWRRQGSGLGTMFHRGVQAASQTTPLCWSTKLVMQLASDRC